MKTNTRNLSTHFFNLKLFLEGLKRLRVIGLATAILAITASALPPIVYWIEWYHSSMNHRPITIEGFMLCIALPFVTLLAPFFLFVLFSFLQKRKESDFFHAIPYTRTCVYVSFVAAALAFVWAIQIAASLISCLLWGMVPNAVFSLGSFIPYVLCCLLASAMLSGFMMLALTVSGTPGSCMLLFALFTCFTRVVLSIFLGSLESIDLLPSIEMFSDSFFSPYWFLPLNVFHYMVETESAARLMYTPSNILYSIFVTIGIYALAGLIYKKRKSEMAGSPAPGRITQTLFRVMFTLIPALLIPFFWISGDTDFAIHVALLIIVLLVYFLYELITTKRAINMVKAIPSLIFVVIGCVVFLLGFQSYQTVVLKHRTDADEIKLVTIEAGGVAHNSYQSHLLYEMKISDPAVLEMVAKQLAYSQDCERFGEMNDDYWNRTKVTLHLKNGITIRRNIIFSVESNDRILDTLRELESVREALYRLPSDEEIDGGVIYVDLANRSHYLDLYHSQTDLIALFREEYESLTQEQKDRVMAPTFWQEYAYEDKYADTVTGEIRLELNGRVNGYYYNSLYVVIPEMKRTYAAVIKYWTENANNNIMQNGDSLVEGSSDRLVRKMMGMLESESFRSLHESFTVSLNMIPVGKSTNSLTFTDRLSFMSADDLYKLLEIMSNCASATGNIEITEKSYVVYLNVEDPDNEYSRLYLEVSALIELSDEDLYTLRELFGG
jgi:ABC-2 type transport system permease protein